MNRTVTFFIRHLELFDDTATIKVKKEQYIALVTIFSPVPVFIIQFKFDCRRRAPPLVYLKETEITSFVLRKPRFKH